MSASQKEKSEKGESNSESTAHDCKGFRRPSGRASEKWNLEKILSIGHRECEKHESKKFYDSDFCATRQIAPAANTVTRSGST